MAGSGHGGGAAVTAPGRDASACVRVVVVDDHPVFRDGVRAVLAGAPDVEVVGEADDGATGVALALDLDPDVVLMDLHMPEVNGVEATRRIRELAPRSAVVVLTMVEDRPSVTAALRAGACGYLLKGATGREILTAVRAAAAGQSVLAAAVAAQLVEPPAGPAGGPGVAARSPADLGSGPAAVLAALGGREREVAELVAAGWDNPAIARRLFLSPKTVRNYVSGLLTRTGLRSRSAFIVAARDAGLGRDAHGPPDDPVR